MKEHEALGTLETQFARNQIDWMDGLLGSAKVRLFPLAQRFSEQDARISPPGRLHQRQSRALICWFLMYWDRIQEDLRQRPHPSTSCQIPESQDCEGDDSDGEGRDTDNEGDWSVSALA
jgi:hypothetical protein